MEEHGSTAGSEEECHSTAEYEEIVPKSEGDACSDVDSYTEYLPSPVPEFNLEADSEEDDWPLGSGNSLILPSHMYKETMEKVEFGKIRLEMLEGRLGQLRQLECGEGQGTPKGSKDDHPPPHAYQAILDSAARVKELSRQLRAVQLHSSDRRAGLLDRLRLSQENHRHALQELTELKAEVVAAESIFHSRIQVWESLLQQKRDKKWELKLALDSINKES